jgi:hypothetical protein
MLGWGPLGYGPLGWGAQGGVVEDSTETDFALTGSATSSFVSAFITETDYALTPTATFTPVDGSFIYPGFPPTLSLAIFKDVVDDSADPAVTLTYEDDSLFEFNFESDILAGGSPFDVFKDNGGAISPYVFTVQTEAGSISGDATKVSATSNSTNVRWVGKLKEAVFPQADDQEILMRAKILINGNGALEIQFRSQYDDITEEYTGYRLKLSTLGGASDPLDADTLEVRLRRLRGTGTEDTLSGGGGAISQEYAEWFWVRLQAEDTDIRCKIWNSDDSEPGSWTFDITDTNMLNDGPVTDPGFVMIVGFHPVAYSAFTYPDMAIIDYFAVETNSANWPIPLPEAP